MSESENRFNPETTNAQQLLERTQADAREAREILADSNLVVLAKETLKQNNIELPPDVAKIFEASN